jgi:glycosyltransferase involved in cell wall biosynthesis
MTTNSQEFEGVNLLIRTSNRPKGFDRLMKSIGSQTYCNTRIIVSVDNDETYDYVTKYWEVDKIVRNEWIPRENPNHNPYNLYQNKLLDEVESGWVYFIDDDDLFIDENSLQTIYDNLSSPNLIHIFRVDFQNLRAQLPRSSFGKKPTRGDIGTPCFVLHSSVAKRFKWKDVRCGDFFYINEIANSLGIENIKWVNKVIFKVPSIGGGKRLDIGGS